MRHKDEELMRRIREFVEQFYIDHAKGQFRFRV